MTAIDRRRCVVTGSIAAGAVRELTNSTGIEGPLSIVNTICAPPKRKKGTGVHGKERLLAFSSIPGTYIRDRNSARPRPGSDRLLGVELLDARKA
jgi:hypothetical protein